MSTSYLCKNLAQTKKLAQSLSRTFSKGDVILLIGDLGSGKTTFTQFFLKAFGVTNKITSPTFTIVNEYVTDKLKFYHFDMYRLAGYDEALLIGVDEMLSDDEAIKIIEWPEKIEEILPKNSKVIKIQKINDNSREFIVGDLNEEDTYN